MHDANGTPLNVGDKVLIPAVVTELHAGDDYCNVSLETTLGRRPDAMKERLSGINTGVLVKFVTLLIAILLVASFANAAEAPRSGHWPSVRAAYLHDHPTCEACGKAADLTVHHIVPFHIDPSRELDATNLITLCHTCHLVFGHLGDYQSYNPNVREDAAAYLAKVKARPPRATIKLLPRQPIRRTVHAAFATAA
jgi:5-methylcytosine-specific restriction enzyme A